MKKEKYIAPLPTVTKNLDRTYLPIGIQPFHKVIKQNYTQSRALAIAGFPCNIFPRLRIAEETFPNSSEH